MDSLLIEGARLWVYRGELQAVFATELWTLAACCFVPLPDSQTIEMPARYGHWARSAYAQLQLFRAAA